MRLFVALPVPAPVRADLAGALAAHHDATPVRWSRSETWHVTLAFLGEVDPATVAPLSTRLARAAARYAPMTLRLQGSGAFPRPAAATTLWVGLDAPRPELPRLAASTVAAARRVGIEVDDRPYRPHLTVGRLRTRTDVRDLVAALQPYAGPSWTATELHLVRSHLGARPRYEVLAHHPLSADPP